MIRFFDFSLVEGNGEKQDYCLRCGARVYKANMGYLGDHSKFCRLRFFLTSREKIISIPIENLIENGSEKLTILSH